MAMLRRLILRNRVGQGQRGPPFGTPTIDVPAPPIRAVAPIQQPSIHPSVSDLPVQTGPLAHLANRRVTVVLDLDYLVRQLYRRYCQIHMDRLADLLATRTLEFAAFGLTFRGGRAPEIRGLERWTVVEDSRRSPSRFHEWRAHLAMHTLCLAARTNPDVLVLGTTDPDLRWAVTSTAQIHCDSIQVYSLSLPVMAGQRGGRAIHPRDRWHINIGRDVVSPASAS